MSCWTCSPTVFRDLSRAMAKSAAAKLRTMKALPMAENWTLRAAACERCPLHRVYGSTTYCGKPFLRQIDRDPAVDGCGCPTREKAKSPAEHCPIDARNHPAVQGHGTCNCKWCVSVTSRRDMTLMAA